MNDFDYYAYIGTYTSGGVITPKLQSKGIYILIGSLPIKLGNKITNRSFLIGSNGKILYKYDKIHLYDVNLPNGEIYKESDTYSSGDKAIVGQIQEDKFKIGMTICLQTRKRHSSLIHQLYHCRKEQRQTSE